MNEQWKSVQHNSDDELSSLIQIPAIIKTHSKNPLEKIKSNLLINMIFAAVIAVLYIYIIWKFPAWQIRVCIGVILVFNIWSIVSAWPLYRNLSRINFADLSLLEELKWHHSAISSWVKATHRAAIFVYPISAAGGFMLGGILGSGKSVEEFMQHRIAIIALIISIVVLVPLCYRLAKWMSRKTFGKALAGLQEYIRQLES